MELFMRIASKLIIFCFASLALAASAYAQSTRDQFKTAVAAFQQNATEDTARKLAELYKQLNPPPGVPEDAEFRALKGAAFFKQASDISAFGKAAAEFRAAIAIAPWVGEYHYNLAISEKSAGRFDAAQAAIKFAQIFARDDKERRECLALRAELEAAQELAAVREAVAEENSPQAKARKIGEFVRSLNGAKFVGETSHSGNIVILNVYEIHGQEVHYYDEIARNPNGESLQTNADRPRMRNPGDNNKPAVVMQLQGREFAHFPQGSTRTAYMEISEDGQKIRTLIRTNGGDSRDNTAQNQTEPRRVR
jgi:hypothetical protein